jgi:type IV pilus assembly protein PilE
MKGFTLIELMVVILIVGILSSIAYPSYLNYVKKSRRAEAQSTLIDLVSRQEMYYLDHHEYASSLNSDLGLSADPLITVNGYYSIKTSSAISTAVGFTLTATAIGQQSDDSDCATLSINEAYEKTATNANSTNCWK